jgi:HAD superfamily hydrolase (TIGR01509 family)
MPDLSSPSHPPLEAVVFDVDGTLAETERDGHRVAFNAAFKRHRLPFHWSVEEYGDLLAVKGGHRRLETYLASRGVDDTEGLAMEIHRTKTVLFSRWIRLGVGFKERPGARALLAGLRASGVRLAVASTGRRDWVEPLLRRLFADVPFEVVVAGDDVRRLKPDPEGYGLALDRLQVPPERALAIEDSPSGLAAARAAGLACVVVVSSYNLGADFSGASAVVEGYLPGDGKPSGPAASCLAKGVTAEALRCVHAAALCD